MKNVILNELKKFHTLLKKLFNLSTVNYSVGSKYLFLNIPTVGIEGDFIKKEIINIKHLSKEYDSIPIFSNLNLTIYEHEIYGLLGANGVGKTTLLKIIIGFLEVTDGSTTVFAKDSWQSRSEILSSIGCLIESPMFYEHLSAKENLEIHLAYMNKQASIDDVLTLVGLSGVMHKPVSKFSLGMRQRLAIARAIVHQPKLLILDEPINGLDPIAIKEMRDLFIRLSKQGMTIIISSHILSEIEHTVTRVGILSNGSLALDEAVDVLRSQHPNNLEDYLINIMKGGI